MGDNIWIMVGPTFLFTIWGAALAVGTLGYHYRRRGPCEKCGRGAPGELLVSQRSTGGAHS
jgi:hypothetical protein